MGLDELPGSKCAQGASPIRFAESEADIRRCFAVMVQLRPHVNEDEFVRQVRRQQDAGYRLAFLAEGEAVRAVAGFRIQETFFIGKHLYVDDLVTDAAERSRGHGAKMFDWLADQARAHGCRALDLDSSVQRAGAHRFYLRQGMHVSSFHFRMMLDEPARD